MSRIEQYREELKGLADWEPYLLAHSGLPGPRGNLELAHAVAQEGAEVDFWRWVGLESDAAPENTPEVFLAFCGVLGLGALLARGGRDEHAITRLRQRASDERWRIREAVATGLQLWGDVDMVGLLAEMRSWAEGDYYEQRAAAAALCEPRLLRQPEHALAVLAMLDRITAGVAAAPATERKAAPYRTLCQGMSYCWSVAVAAHPEAGAPLFRKWLASDDPDVRRVMRENLRKKRIAHLGITEPEQDAD